MCYTCHQNIWVNMMPYSICNLTRTCLIHPILSVFGCVLLLNDTAKIVELIASARGIFRLIMVWTSFWAHVQYLFNHWSWVSILHALTCPLLVYFCIAQFDETEIDLVESESILVLSHRCRFCSYLDGAAQAWSISYSILHSFSWPCLSSFIHYHYLFLY